MGETKKPRLAESLRGLIDAGLHTVQTRVELFAVEVQEEKLRVASLLLNSVLTGFLLGAGIVVLAVFFTVLLWDEHRLIALAVAAFCLIGGGLLTARNAAREFKRGSRLFHASLTELMRDRDALRREE